MNIEYKTKKGDKDINIFALNKSFDGYLNQMGIILSSCDTMYCDLLHSFYKGVSYSMDNINFSNINKNFCDMLSKEYKTIVDSNHFDWLRDFYFIGFKTYEKYKKDCL